MKSPLLKTPIAIIGMAGIFPKAKNLREYWENIINKIDCITDVPPSRWNIDDYYDPEPSAPDKIYCKRGGFIPHIDFNPMEFGLPPNILEITDTSQLLSLVVAKQAIADAGYLTSNRYRERTGVILGVGGGLSLITPLTSRLQYPVWKRVLKSSGISDEDTQKIIEKIKLAYIPWEENSFPGMLGNVIAGRIANRLDLGGINCVADAACASSLAALQMALSELTEYRSDMMITGGVDTDNSTFMYMSFSKTPAFSKQQHVKPFDTDSDGMMIGEGIGMLVLKRLEDAKRDKDRIYAVIKGIGTSSDGKYKSIYAPRASGQTRALHRAYDSAGFTPASVGLVEAHGTGTLAGDPTEFAALNAAFSENNNNKQHIALGSVKSQIGHTKSTAGAASLVKTALALHHKILPPTINITKPNPKLGIEDSPFYLNTETRPWLRSDAPRRAGVSAFGFGGSNYHVVLEEYDSEQNSTYRLHHVPASILLVANTPAQLLEQCSTTLVQLQSDQNAQHFEQLIDSSKSLEIPMAAARVGFVANAIDQARDLLQITIDLLKKRSTVEFFEHPKGIYYRKTGLETNGKVVALFSGQGSQYLDMGREIALNFPPLRQAYTNMDKVLHKEGLAPISDLVFPSPRFDIDQKKSQVAALQQTENAQPAIGTFSLGLYKIFQQTGFQADFVAGHSFGELTALWAAGVLNDEDYFFLVQARGQAMASPVAPNFDTGTMLAVTGDMLEIQKIVEKFSTISVANWNSNSQVVLGGPTPDIEKIKSFFEKQDFSTVLLPVSAAFHTSHVKHAHKPFAEALNSVTFNYPKIPVYSNITGAPYPDNPGDIQKMLASHILNPVGFKQEIENLYAAGGYYFIEFGPRNILTALVTNILADKPHLAVALNASRKKDSDRQLREAIIKLRVAGLPLRDIDPYSSQSPLLQKGEVKKGKGLIVRLNGANYVSEKTRAAFENALQDGHQVSKVNALNSAKANALNSAAIAKDSAKANALNSAKANALNSAKANALNSAKANALNSAKANALNSAAIAKDSAKANALNSAKANALNSAAIAKDSAKANALNAAAIAKDSAKANALNAAAIAKDSAKANALNAAAIAKDSAKANALNAAAIAKDSAKANALNSAAIAKDSTKKTWDFKTKNQTSKIDMAQPFENHQPTETLHVVHQHYLKNLEAYSQQFFQLIQQQYTLLTHERCTPAMLESFERGMAYFHEHQAQMQRVHEQYLKTQVEYSHSVLQLMPHSPLATSDATLQREAQRPMLSQATAENAPVESALPVSPTPTVNESVPPAISPSPTVEESVPPTVSFTPPTTPSPVESKMPVAEPVSAPASIPEPEESTEVKNESAATPAIDLGPLTQSMLNVVSEKTGYPADMLEIEMDMEADLGIDSIKRVEILGAMQEQFPDLPPVDPDELAELRTLGEIVEYMGRTEKKN